MVKQRVVFLLIYFATPVCSYCSNEIVFWFDVAATTFCIERRDLRALLVKSVEGLCWMSEQKMGFDPLNWYCQPAENSVWDKAVDSVFGPYTPCAINTLVISISNLVLIGLCLYRIWLIICNAKVERFCLRSNYYNYLLGMLAAYCSAQPLLRLLTGNSAFNLSGETGFAPFEVGVSCIVVYYTPMRFLCLNSQCLPSLKVDI